MAIVFLREYQAHTEDCSIITNANKCSYQNSANVSESDDDDDDIPDWWLSSLTGKISVRFLALSYSYVHLRFVQGITNTVGAIPGIVGIALTGFLLDSTHSWSISLFAPAILFYLTGTVVWLAFASTKPQSFSKLE